jgi:hypothetical protein
LYLFLKKKKHHEFGNQREELGLLEEQVGALHLVLFKS